MSKRKEDSLCIECKEKVTNKQHAVSCCVCDRWVHKDCGIDDDEYKLIDKIFKKKGSHFWSCDGCSRGLSKLQQIVSTNVREIATLKERCDDLDIAKDKHTTDIQDANDKISTLSTEVSDLKEKGLGDHKNDSVYHELDLKESKKANLMLYNVREQDNNLPAIQRKQSDENLVRNIIAETGIAINIESDLKFVARVGEYSDEKVRPVTVGFRNINNRDKVLISAWKLGKSKNHHEISISPDLTKIQLSKEKELQQEAKDKNEALTGDDAKNYIWKLIGVQGQRQLKKVKKKMDQRSRIHSVRRGRAEMEEDSDSEVETRSKKQC